MQSTFLLLALSAALQTSPSAATDGIVLNEVVDDILAGVKEELLARNQDVLPINDAYREWSWKKSFIRLSGVLSCRNGEVGYLTTIHRTGDVVLSTEDNKLILRAKMGIQNLFLKYEECSASVSHLLSASNRVGVSMENNKLDGQITLTRNGNQCHVKVDHMKIEQMGDLEVDVGNSVFQRVLDKLIEMLADLFRDQISDAINRKLEEAANEHLPDYDICEKLFQ